MLLAGGQGTRLKALTAKVAKPAVSFGSKYRIIDFTLSNCANSNIDTVGILTQYEPLLLNDYINDGKPWDLDRANGGAHILSPYQAKKGAEWYKGTANAIYQNIKYLEKYDSDHVLILSGDHIYKMDYSLMLAEHVKHDADCTIAVIDVDLSEAPRFGIMSYDEAMRITDFEEKPPKPKSNKASMGIYIFKKDVLVEELMRDENDPASSKDFGKNIIPYMLKTGRRMYAYRFTGYWKDVGTLESLWEANMDLLGSNPAIRLNEPYRRIFANNDALPPCYIGERGEVVGSIVTAGCEIEGRVENSVISENVSIGRGSVVRNSVIMRDTAVGENVVIDYAIVDEDVRIGGGSRIGGQNAGKERLALIGRGSRLNEETVVPAGGELD
jgi:glucose-1-phosphate adenylyltransferase